jgi:MFS family permease
MLQTLETTLSQSQPAAGEDATVKQAVLLLGLSRVQQPETLANPQVEFGRLAWSAVSNPQRTSRLISALALSSAFPAEFTGRLEEALNAWESVPGRAVLPAWRRAEVRGNLLDSGITLAKGEGKGSGGSFWIWAWRFGRRLLRHSRRLTAMLVGSALGAGLVLGGWYCLVYLLAQAWGEAGSYLAAFAFLGAMLGAVTALGVGLAEPILLEDSREPELHPPQWRRPLRYAWLPDGLGVVLAMLAFGLMHALLAIVVSFPIFNWHMIPMGFLAGLGISLGLYGQPRVGLKLGWRGWLPRLAVAAVLVAATQFVPCLAGTDWYSTNFTYAAKIFRSLYIHYDYISLFFVKTACESGFGLNGLLSTLNAAVLGALLTFSCAFGMDTALRKLKEWRRRDKDDPGGEK